MKILFLTSDLKSIGGITQYRKHLLRALADLGHDLKVIELKESRNYQKIIFVIKSVSCFLAFRPDIIFCGHINFYPVCYFLKKVFGSDYIIFTYGIDVWGIKNFLRVKALKTSKKIVAISRYTKDELSKLVGETNVFLLSPAVEGDKFYPTTKPSRLLEKYNLREKKVIFTLARLSKQERYKGYDKVIKAFPRIVEKVPEAIYIIGGPGNDILRIKALVKERGLEDRVILTDFISDEELANHYNLCDVFVMPSKREGFGIVFIEALACGKPVVAGNQDGSRDALLDGELGILVDPDNESEVVGAIVGMLKKEVPGHLLNGNLLRKRVLEVYGFIKFKKAVDDLLGGLTIDTVSISKPKDFKSPTELPQSELQAKEWQAANYEWWQSHPMRYDWKKAVSHKEFTKDFYKEIDKRFFDDAREYLPQNKFPFDSLIKFDSLKRKDVLEVGVGSGSHAGLLAKYSKSFTGIDLTDYAVESTKKRMKVFDLKGEVLKMDAEKMEFSDNSFDLVWSWGVIHHSANPEYVLKEIQRVLRPGGRAVTMVYYRGWWNYYIKEIVRGLLSGNLIKTGSLHKSTQLHTDGAMARYYTVPEWKSLTGELFNIDKIYTLGVKSDIIPLPGGKIKDVVLKLIPGAFSRFLTRHLRMGSFLVSELSKK